MVKNINDIPTNVLMKLKEKGVSEAEIRLKTFADLDFLGNPAEIWVVATDDRFIVIPATGFHDQIEIPLEKIKKFRIRASIGSAYLQVKIDEFYIDIVRFTNALRYRFSRLIVQLDLLRQKKPISDEYVNEPHPLTCSVCGLPLQTENASCPRCARQGPIIFRVIALLEPYLHWVIVVLILMFISVGLNLVPPKLTQILVDEVLTTRRHVDWLIWIVIALVSAELTRALINMTVGTLTTSVGTLITYDLRKKLFRKLQELSIDYYDQQSVGTLMTRFSSDVEAFHGFVTQVGQGFLLNLFLIAGIGVMLFFINAKLALYVLIPVPLVMMGTYFFWSRIYPLNFKLWDSQARISKFLNIVLSGIRVVKAFAQEKREIDRFEVIAANLRNSQRRVQISTAKFNPLMAFLFGTGGLIVWYVGGKTVLENQGFTLGQLMAFLSYTGMFYGPLSQLALMSNWVSQFITASHRIFEILDTEPQLKDPPNAIRMPNIKGHIKFEHVTFGYDPYQPIIKDVSFEIEPGQLVGIVGKSGSGKTTLISLICRFYDVQSGAIYIDGKDIREISSYDLRRQIGLVLQEPFLFRASIADNIRYGRPEATFREILNASKAANCHDFIMKLPMGYDLYLREHGAGISGGEKQRIGIARALLCDPPILILDEATSSVDTESEKKIQDALSILCKNRTTIAIAHRLSTLRGADKILVIDNGKIVETGTHQELMEKKGVYYRLVIMQTKLTSIETEVK
ncbi:MAG: ABC transporter ATP-binding protein/permease [Candidatus Omnitrophica bacterium]|nr:ABC transporter ATP-binding protein/permease [Candidatus Omnitrophota bacterium]